MTSLFGKDSFHPGLDVDTSCSFTKWRESDAIMLYLVDKYDKEKRLTVTDEKEKYQEIQWLFFQASGQG